MAEIDNQIKKFTKLSAGAIPSPFSTHPPLVKPQAPATSNQDQQPKPPAASQSLGGANSMNHPSPTPAPDTLSIKKDFPKKSFFDELIFAYEIDIAEIFGGAGEGKSQTVLAMAIDAIKQGKKVRFIDTERGFLRKDIAKLGQSYQYIPNLKGLMEFSKNLPKDIDIIFVDSIGYPVLTEWAKMGVNEKGNALTQIIAIKDLLKDWAINNNKVVIVTNQPDSDFGKDKDYINRPFGDKGQFVIKEVFKIERIERKPDKTTSVLKAFRSRHDGMGMIIATIEITSDGVKII